MSLFHCYPLSSSHHGRRCSGGSKPCLLTAPSPALLLPLHMHLFVVTHRFIPLCLISYIPFPDIQFFIIFLRFPPLLNLFFLSHFKSLEAPSPYLQMTSGSGRLGCDWSPVPAVAVSAPEAFVHLPSLRSFLAGPMVPPSASLCMPCWVLKTAWWAVLGFLRCWIDCGGQWLGWVEWLK